MEHWRVNKVLFHLKYQVLLKKNFAIDNVEGCWNLFAMTATNVTQHCTTDRLFFWLVVQVNADAFFISRLLRGINKSCEQYINSLSFPFFIKWIEGKNNKLIQLPPPVKASSCYFIVRDLRCDLLKSLYSKFGVPICLQL